MSIPYPLIDRPTAKEMAETVARRRSADLNGDDHFLIVDAKSCGHQWGWGFAPVVEPYWSTNAI